MRKRASSAASSVGHRGQVRAAIASSPRRSPLVARAGWQSRKQRCGAAGHPPTAARARRTPARGRHRRCWRNSAPGRAPRPRHRQPGPQTRRPPRPRAPARSGPTALRTARQRQEIEHRLVGELGRTLQQLDVFLAWRARAGRSARTHARHGEDFVGSAAAGWPPGGIRPARQCNSSRPRSGRRAAPPIRSSGTRMPESISSNAKQAIRSQTASVASRRLVSGSAIAMARQFALEHAR